MKEAEWLWLTVLSGSLVIVVQDSSHRYSLLEVFGGADEVGAGGVAMATAAISDF